MTATTLHTVPTTTLKPHPKNAAIYGHEDVRALAARIEQSNWIKPLVATPEQRIISGHRRWQAAKLLAIDTVPVEYRSFESEEDELEALLLENENRDKTTEQKVREAQEWEQIERTRARQRQAMLNNIETASLRPNLDEAKDMGRSDDKAAAKVGMKRSNYDKAKKVIKKADELREQGQEDKAEQLIDTLNHKSVDKAFNQAMRFDMNAQANEAVDAIEAPAETAIDVQSGEVWRLGRHTLYCGDTSSDTFRRLLVDSAFAFADPPYNADAAEWDHDFTWQHDYLYEFAPVVAVTPGISSIFEFAHATAMPYKWSMACWIDNGMTRGEMGFGNWVYVALFADNLFKKAQDVCRVSIDISTSDESRHKGRKPIDLLVYLLNLYTEPSDAVIDPFLGSGTTLIAAEVTGRECIGGEINPQYCADIIARWEKKTGQKAQRVSQ
jgi:ParB-like chromosome segregation protein Spo0J